MVLVGEATKLSVNVVVDILDTDGNLLRQHVGHNLVVNTGLAALAAALVGGAATITTFRVGSDGTAVVAGNTALGAEVASYPPTLVSSLANVTTAQHYISSGQLNGSTLREAGLFIGSTLFARFVYNDVDLQPKSLSVAVVFTWTITFSAS